MVQKLWHFDGLTTHRYERAFPNGIAELIVHLGERFHEARGGEPARFDRCPPLCLSGLQTGPFVVASPPRSTAILGIRFTPLGIYRLLGQPVHPLANQTADLTDLVGPLAAELEDCVKGAPDGPARVRAAAGWVAARIARGPEPDPAVVWVASELERTSGRVRVAALRGQTGFSRSRLATAFREQVGLTPKVYARVLRFHQALGILTESDRPVAEVAAKAGYYDQPHLNGEFRELAGLSPSEFRAATRYLGSVNLAESGP